MLEIRKILKGANVVCDAHVKTATSQIVVTFGGEMNDEQIDEDRRVVWLDCCPKCEAKLGQRFAPKSAKRVKPRKRAKKS